VVTLIVVVVVIVVVLSAIESDQSSCVHWVDGARLTNCWSTRPSGTHFVYIHFLTLPYLTFGVGRLLHLPSTEAVSVRPNAQPRCNQKVTVIVCEAEIGYEAEQITSHLGLVTCSMVVPIRRSALG